MKKLIAIIGALRKGFMDAEVDETTLGDYLLDKVEEFVQRTDNKIDDVTILPVIKGLRILWDIPDQDDKPNLEVRK